MIHQHGRSPSPDLGLALRSVANSAYTAAVDVHEGVEAAARAADKAAEFADGSVAAAAAAFKDTGELGRVTAILASVEHEGLCAITLERGVLELNRATATLASTKRAAFEAATLAQVAQTPWLSARTQVKALRSEARRLEKSAKAMQASAKSRDLIHLRRRAEASEAQMAEALAAASMAGARVGQLTREAEHLRSLPDDRCAFESASGRVAQLSKAYDSTQRRLANTSGEGTGSFRGGENGGPNSGKTTGIERSKDKKNIEQLSRHLIRARTALALVEQWFSMSVEARQSATELEESVYSIAREGRDRVARRLSDATERAAVLASEAEALRVEAGNHRQALQLRSQQITNHEALAAEHLARAAKLNLKERVLQQEVSALKRDAMEASRRANEAESRHEQAVRDHAAQVLLVDKLREALGEARTLVDAERSISAGDAERAAREAQQDALEAEKYSAEALALAERAKRMAAR